MKEKIRVKLSHPSSWFKHGHWSYLNHFPKLNPIWGNCHFEINNDAVTECDVWVVHESLTKSETVKCPPENIILVISEEKQQVKYYNPEYLKQFGLIVTSRDDIMHPNVLRTFNFNPWRVRKTYGQIAEAAPSKNDDLSVIVSNNVSTAGHLKRYSFANRLKGHFKDRMIWFGKGENEIEDKWNGLQSYRYSLAMENCSVPYYFTEKIMDCFCASTMPIYWGCKNIFDYYPQESILSIDVDDFKGSIEVIERAIADNLYEKNYQAVQKAKDLTINKYQFIPAIVDVIISRLNLGELPRKRSKIKPNTFDPGSSVLKQVRKLKKYFFD